ncbi:dystroglycan-like [Dorcoceras hygrometricum]|uniref:Dystroglycan-like n=1 Tax=Dorcoceras hygrometricum TaxID=472368 RepID=A0A2Z7CMM7_9LAMI|nr:dystroglycan-like [Dorcoceras hygrometricum]
MAASFYSNSIHVDFDSVLAMDEPGMVSMFQTLVASGLQRFLGCTAVVYEEALVEFFANGRVRDGLVVSSVDGVIVEISEKLFAKMFELPIVGLADVSEMPKDKIFDARSIVSMTGEPVLLSGSKSQMKMPFRLLCDILAKSISGKAGSFNALTVEKFSLLTAVVCDVKMNWGSVLFGILKKMVTPGSKQGFAIQLSLILESFHNLKLGESSEFPPSKILTKKTTHRYIAIIIKSGAQEPFDAPQVTKASKKKVASKKRPADISFDVPVIKKKRTIKKKSVSSISTLELVAVAEEAIPIQQVAEPSAVQEPRCPSADDVDLIIQQVLVETREADEPADKAQSVVTEEKHWFDLPYDAVPVDIPLPSSSMEITKIMMGKSIKIPGVNKWTWFLKSLPRIPTDDKGKEILVEKDPVKGNPAKEHYSLICADIDLLVDLRAKVIDEVAQFLNSFSLKKLATINFEDNVQEGRASFVLGRNRVSSEVQAVIAKVDIMASRLNAIQNDAEATKEALSHQLLEFQSSAQENHNVIHAQLSEFVDYIHRGSADKKGESGSRGLQQPSNVQVSASAERTPTFEQRVEMAQRYIVHTVLDADANRALFARKDAAERDRERRRREARALKRRRRD